jgi:hypothetical protein
MLIKREMDEIRVGDTNDDCHVGGRTRVLSTPRVASNSVILPQERTLLRHIIPTRPDRFRSAIGPGFLCQEVDQKPDVPINPDWNFGTLKKLGKAPGVSHQLPAIVQGHVLALPHIPSRTGLATLSATDFNLSESLPHSYCHSVFPGIGMAKSSEGFQSDNEVEGKTSLSSQHAQVQPLTLTPKHPSPQSIRVDSPKHSSTHVDVEEAQPDSAVEFRLYKRRFAGVVGLVCHIFCEFN